MISKSLLLTTGVPAFLLAGFGTYSIAWEVGGPCNAGIVFIVLLLLLFTTALPHFIVVASFREKQPADLVSKILLIAALLVWSLACVFIIPQLPLRGSLLFLPYLLTIVLAVLRAFSRRDAK
jgi:hypothetical protein